MVFNRRSRLRLCNLIIKLKRLHTLNLNRRFNNRPSSRSRTQPKDQYQCSMVLYNNSSNSRAR